MEPAQKLAVMLDHQTVLYIINLVIYILFGIILVVLVLAIFECLNDNSHVLAMISAAFGLIWAGLVIAGGMIANIGTEVVIELYSKDPVQATSVWLAIDSVVEALGGGNEIIGGFWTLLVSLAALRANLFPKILNYLGGIIGLAGILSAIPALGELGGMIFGLGQIVWFIWLGIAMLSNRTKLAYPK